MVKLDFVVVYLITYLFMTFCIARLFRICASQRINILFEIAGYVVYYITVSLVYLCLGIPMVVFIINVLGIFALSHMYEKSIKKNVLMVVLIYFMMIISECLGMVICGHVPENVWGQAEMASQMALIVQCIVMSLSVQVYKKFEGVSGDNNVAWRSWGSVLVIQLLLIYFVISLAEQLNSEYLIRATLLITVINFVVIYIYDRLLISEQERSNNLLIMEQNKSYLREMDVLMESQKKVRGIYHDLKNHVLVIRSYLAQEKYKDLGVYLDRLQEETKYVAPKVYTGQPTVDSMLRYKMGVAEKAGIKLKLNAIIPEKLMIDDFDITVLLGNLLDNAVEACGKLEERMRNISLTLRLSRNQLFILVENPFVGKIKWHNGMPSTEKMDKSSHGLGLQNVKRVVDKHDGVLEIKNEDGVFKVKIMLYLG